MLDALIGSVAAIGVFGLLACRVACAAGFETVILKDGQRIIGEVVAEKSNALYVDLGYDLLRIPRTRCSGGPRSTRPRPAIGAPARGPDLDTSGLFTTGVLKPAGVKELVNKYGEAVISIETPSGKGSGFLINKDGYAITNAHVIQGETRVSAILYLNVPGGLSRRRIEDVEIVALNPFFDLALLKLPLPSDLKPSHVVLGNGDDVNAGDSVLRGRQSAGPGADGHAGDREQPEPQYRGADLPPDRHGDQPGQLGRAAVQPAGRGDRRDEPGAARRHGRQPRLRDPGHLRQAIPPSSGGVLVRQGQPQQRLSLLSTRRAGSSRAAPKA